MTPRSPSRRHDREIVRLALPAFATLLAQPLYILADTAVVGHLGTPQLGGLAVASTLVLLGYAAFIFLAYGTTANVARLLGAGDEREAAHEAVQSLWLALVLGIVTAVLAAVWAPQLLQLVGAEGAVAREGLVYLRISLLGFPSMLLVLGGIGYLRGLQNTRLPFVVAIGTALFNLVLEVVLIYGFGFGIGASALTTVLAETIAAGAYVFHIARAVTHHHVELRPHLSTIGRLARLGGNLFIRTVALRGALTVSTAVAARLGTKQLAGYQVAFEVWNFLAHGVDAIAIAGQALVGRFLGASQPDEARSVGHRMNQWSVVFGVALGAILVILRYPIASIFTEDREVITLAAASLVWVAVLQPVNGLAFSLDGILIGAGDARFLAWAMAGASAIFIPAALAVILLDAGLGWLWASLGLFMSVRALTLYARFSGERWTVSGPRIASQDRNTRSRRNRGR